MAARAAAAVATAATVTQAEAAGAVFVFYIEFSVFSYTWKVCLLAYDARRWQKRQRHSPLLYRRLAQAMLHD